MLPRLAPKPTTHIPEEVKYVKSAECGCKENDLKSPQFSQLKVSYVTCGTLNSKSTEIRISKKTTNKHFRWIFQLFTFSSCNIFNIFAMCIMYI